MDNNLGAVFLALAILALLPSHAAYSDHGGGGGGCSGDCTPPTLGADRSGKYFVSNGFGINGFFVDVEHFEQDVPTQTAVVGKPVEITVRAYENGGPGEFSHAGLMLGLQPGTVSGVRIDSHPVQISWDKTFDQNTSWEVLDENNLVGDVSVEYGLAEDRFGYDAVAELRFSFTPLRTFDTGTIMVQTWDLDRNSWTNFFYNALLITDADRPASPIGDIKIHDPGDEILKIPSWIKLNAGLWARSQIDDATFVQGIKYCIDSGIMNIPDLPDYEPEGVLPFVDLGKGQQYYLDRYYGEPVYREWFDETFPGHTIEEAVGLGDPAAVPSWIKSNAGLWASGEITDDDFAGGIEYLVENGIIIV